MREIDYKQLELLILDCDGVLTDGRIYLTSSGEEMKVFHVRDGSGMKYWKRAGKRIGIITGRGSQVVATRGKELGVDRIRMNVKRKLPAYVEILAEMDCQPHQVAVVGDDLTDLPMMHRCGFAACPSDAVGEVRRDADYVSHLPGGRGCVREIVEYILKQAGDWEGILDRYYNAQEGESPK
jgi:3-deoxy-D-manno-octulosonate 8-phosphate phosphatase (KDO 8-P phosphatase)